MQRIAILAAGLLGLSLNFAQPDQPATPRMGMLLWGDDGHGQCQAPPLSSDAKQVQIACGTNHTLALQSNGQLLAWGANDYGQVLIPRPPAGATFQRVAASDHNLALRNDGMLLAWGRDDCGQCEVPVLPRGLVWTAISAGGLHSAALRSDGAILCWGDDSSFQCDVPRLPLGLSYVAVSAGARHTAALRSDGSVLCWGDNSRGQCEVPQALARQPIVSISAGGGHTLALGADGRLWAWGSNDAGQCLVPRPPYGRVWVEAAAGGRHSLGRLDDGSLLCWGANEFGQGSLPKKLEHFDVVRISAGARHNAALFQALASDIVPVCLGDGSFGPCPCDNKAPAGTLSGCLNSTKRGGRMAGFGDASILADDLWFAGEDLPQTVALLVQGGLGPLGGSTGLGAPPFGDGRLCLQGAVLRLGMVNAISGSFVFPDVGMPPISVLGRIGGPGEVYYQAWYRDPQPVCKGDGSNTTNALRVVWTL